MSFWGELKRRNVFKVGAAYLIAAWLIVQVVSIAFPAFHMPEWTLTFVMSLLIIGFFVALILAWAYEVTPDGVKLTKKVPLADSITHVTGRKLNYVLAGLLIVAVGYIIVLQFFINKPPVQTEVPSTVAEQSPTPTEAIEVKESTKTIAVLPFADLSPEKDQEYFVVGLSEEILNSLAKIPNLLVTARTSSFTFKDSEKTVQEIAEVLGVAHILEGSVRKAGNALRITVQLIRASDGFHLWSETYNRELEDIFAVQEDIATTVANELKLTLGIDSSFKQLGGTDNVEAYEFYLAAKGLLESLSLEAEDMSHSIASVDAAIEIDPDFAMAWALKAKINGISLASFGPIENSAAEQEEGLRAALKAIELEPNLAAGYISLGGIRACTNDWIGAQLALSKAIEFSTEPTDENLPAFNINVGHFKRAKEILESTRKNDPLNELNRMRYILTFGFLGDYKRVDEEYQHFASLLEDTMGPIGLMNIWLLGLGAYDSSVRDGMEWTHPISDVAKEYLQSPEEGIAELRRIYTGNEILSVSENFYISLWAAYFGDPEFAMDALEKGIGIHSGGLFVIWYPAMREVRQLLRFKEFVREIGLLEYWEQFGWPDICRPLDNGDFECD